MPENGNGSERERKIVVTDRKIIEITDVTGVLSFDEEEIVLETGAGKLSVDGEGLRITVLSLDSGRVSAVGKINGIVYIGEKQEKRGGVFGRRG
ncbi:MAG: sporulation protein YabP [Clostridia bacterium]|nr:sporulation protein YabP [Clostridia bacterium]